MKTQKIAILLTTITITSNHLCMEKPSKEPLDLLIGQLKRRKTYYVTQNDEFHELHDTLTKSIVGHYTTINPAQQYKMLKACIDFCDGKWLVLCLHHYNFNPNRYHKKLSLLHYAIQEKNYSALCDLAYANNIDLVPLHDLKATFAEKPVLETPLDFVVRLRDTPGNSYDTIMRYQECVRIMIQAIKTKYNDIIFNKKHCGLTKHLIGAERPCRRCIEELSLELQWHSVRYIPYRATSDYSSTATEAYSRSITDSYEK